MKLALPQIDPDSLTDAEARRLLDEHGYPPIAGADDGTVAAPEAAPPEGSTPPEEPSDPASEAPPWASQLSTRMDDVVGRLESWENGGQPPAGNPLEAIGNGVDPAAEPPAGQAPAPPAAEPVADPAQAATTPSEQELIQQYIDQRAQAQAQEVVGPVLQEIRAERRQQEVAGLLEDYPELRDTETAQATFTEAQRWAQSAGNAQLAGEPAFIELVFLAGKTASAAESETPAGGDQGVQLETPSGANPGTAPSADDTAERIKNAVPGGSFWGTLGGK